VLSGAPSLLTSAQTNSPVSQSPYAISVSQDSLTAQNYTFNFVNGWLTVTSAVLTVSADDQGKVYGQTNPVLTATYRGWVNGESLTNSDVTGLPALATSAQTNSPVGNYEIAVSLGSLQATNQNYVFAFTNGALQIGLAALTPQVAAQDKVYDSQTNATLTSQTLAGVLFDNDVHLLVGAASFADKNVGSAKTVFATGLTLTGLDATNYLLATNLATTSANITRAGLTVSGITASGKVYDGTPAATLDVSQAELIGVFANDDVTLDSSTATGTFAGANVGVGKSVAITGLTISDIDADNYTLAQPSTTADITSSPLTVTANDTNKAHGTTLTFAGTEFTREGQLFGSDTLTSVTLTSAGAASFATEGHYDIIPSDATGSGLTNYAIEYVNGSLTVVDLPQIVSHPASRTNNAGTTATFTVGANSLGALTYQWFRGNAPLSDGGNISGITNATLVIHNVSDEDVASYTVQVSDLAGPVMSGAANLTVIDPPTLVSLLSARETNNATSTASFAINVSGTAPFSYQWRKITPTSTNLLMDEGNISGSTSNILTINNLLAADQADYEVTVSNPAGSVTTNGNLIVIDPIIVTQPVSVTNSLGSSVTFAVTAAGTETLNYQWQQDGYDLPFETDSTLTLDDVQDSDQGEYTVVVYNDSGEAVSEAATLTLTHPPVIVTQPASQVVNPGTNVTFAVSASGLAPFTYQWLFNGNAITGATNRFLRLSHVGNADTGAYRVVVGNQAGSQSSQVATLTVAIPPAITAEPTNVIAIAGQTVSFCATASGTPLAYQWHWNHGILHSATGPTLTLNNVTTNDAGTYSVTVTNIGGTATSRDATLAVYMTTAPVLRVAVAPNHQFTVNIAGVPTYRYAVQVSSNLLDWVTVSTNTAPFTIIDTNWSDSQFYRAGYLP
jgi:hypothetical protein